jgi:hypothetical protein
MYRASYNKMAAVGEKNYRPIINLGDKKNEQLCESMR